MRSIPELLQSFEAGEVFTAFDTETTGLKPYAERIIEIGAIRFDRNGVIARFNQLINPEKKITAEITGINGISNEMVADKPAIRTVLPDFLRFIGSSTIVAHNAPFDMEFLNTELSRCLLPHTTNDVVDTLKLSRLALPLLGKYNQPFLARFLHIEAINAHRAEDDARVCMEIFLALLRENPLTARS